MIKETVPKKRRLRSSSLIYKAKKRLSKISGDKEEKIYIQRKESFASNSSNIFVSDQDSVGSQSVKSINPLTISSGGLFLKRNMAIDELIKTERDFYTQLKLLQTKFIEPLQLMNYVSSNDIVHLFLNINEIIECSEAFITDFDSLVFLEDEIILVGKIFEEHWEKLRSFELFCSFEERALQTLEKLKSNQNFVDFCQQVFTQNEFRQLKLQDFLMKPLQRITKYPLLIQVPFFFLKKNSFSFWLTFETSLDNTGINSYR